VEKDKRGREIYRRESERSSGATKRRLEKRRILWKERIYNPNLAILREEVITKYHDSKLAGHPGYTKTYELITRNY